MAYIGVIDYGMGNLRSVAKAIEHLGGTVYVGSDTRKLSRAEKLILPGVGAFGHAMRELKKRGLITFLSQVVADGTPILGICLGLQLFFERSEESPQAKGLGIWNGVVVKLKSSAQAKRKIPHMGWNQVDFKKRSGIVSKVANRTNFYFVHSYYARPKERNLIIGVTNYGVQVPAILGSGSIFAVQFHPEKSQRAGLQILNNFIHMRPC